MHFVAADTACHLPTQLFLITVPSLDINNVLATDGGREWPYKDSKAYEEPPETPHPDGNLYTVALIESVFVENSSKHVSADFAYKCVACFHLRSK